MAGTTGKGRPPPPGIPGLSVKTKPKQPRSKGGRFGATRDTQDVRNVVLTKRAQDLGVKLGPQSNHEELQRAQERRLSVTAPHLGEPIGKVLERIGRDKVEVDRLWRVWCQLTSAYRTYRLRILDKRIEAKGASFQTSEKIEADPNEKVDVRTEEEKDEGARESYRRWNARLDRLQTGQGHRSILTQAESGMGPELWSGKAPTARGRDAVEALRALARIIDKER